MRRLDRLSGFPWRFLVHPPEEGCAVSAMLGTESVLRRVEHVEVFPGVADAVGEYACP